MNWDMGFALSIFPELLRALGTTVKITFLAFPIALVVGLAVAVVRHARIPVVSGLFTFYVLFVRGTPLLVQLYCAFYILPLYGFTYGALVTGVVVLGLNYSAYTAEVYRSGIEDVAAGQWEAATALSLPKPATWRRIVLPQAVRSVIPLLGNYLNQMFKDSAILFLITVVELLGTATRIGADTYRYFEPYTIVGLLFLAVSYPTSLLVRRLERRYAPTH